MPIRSTAVLRLASSLALASALWTLPTPARAADAGGRSPDAARADEVPPLKRGDVILSDVVGIRTGGIGYLGMLSPGFSNLALSGLFGFSSYGQHQSNPDQGYEESRQILSVNPSVDVVVSGRWTLGASAGFAKVDDALRYVQGPDSEVSTTQGGLVLGVGVRAGYVQPLGHGFSLWPRVGVAYSRGQYTVRSTAAGLPNNQHSSTEAIVGGVDLGLMFRPTSFFYVAVTPELTVGYTEQASVSSMVGSGASWFHATLDTTLSTGFIF